MDELITELKRIADALEAQNRIYVERCEESDARDLAYEQRRVAHDFEIVEKQHAARTAELEQEYHNLKGMYQISTEQYGYKGNEEKLKDE